MPRPWPPPSACRSTAVQPMTNPPPVALGDATVLVLAGPDLA